MGQFAVVKVRGGLNNNYLKVGDFIDMFPADSIGGSSREQAAPRSVQFDFGLGGLERTDIDGHKMILRERGAVGRFYQAHRIGPGDEVIIERTGEHLYHVYPRR